MTDIVYYVAMSLDGFIASRDGSVEWLSTFENAGTDYGYVDFYSTLDALVMGRKTYEQILTFGDWPYPGKPVWVFSRSGIPKLQADVIVTAEAPNVVADTISNLGVRRAWMVGGATLAGSFRQQGLIHSYIVSIIPVILGQGVPLFDVVGPLERLQLLDTKTFPNGVVQLHYQQVQLRS